MKSPIAPSPSSLCRSLAVVVLTAGLLSNATAALIQDNLVSNVPGLAAHLDPNLRNPWGIAESGGSPFWIADNGSGLSTVYDSAGAPQGLVVTIPLPVGGTSAPTGAVFNGNAAAFGGAPFLFATEQGTIAAWSGGTTAATMVDSVVGVYTGLANTADTLYAANFASGRIDAYDASFDPVFFGANFIDPNLPAGYAPFGIRAIDGDLYVTYAMVDPATGDEVAGAGLGIVNVFDTGGALVRRLIGAGGALNAPWGLALVPAGFGAFEGDLLVGNFGDGRINAFDPDTGTFLGTLADVHGNPFVNDGLWGLQFGNGGAGGLPNVLYLTAGINDERDGLLAAIHVPEPGTLALVGVAVVGIAFIVWRRSR
jgi:uncharacterized protein (TIGR03118 family)